MQLHAPIRMTPPPIAPAKKPRRRKGIMLRLIGFAFTAGVFLFLTGAGVAGYILWQISKELPAYDKLATYEPWVMTRVHANDGRLIAEFAEEKRIHMPINAIPKMVTNAFVAIEDKHFYEHGGLDFQGIARALINNLTKGKREGASTITQQVAKNFLLTNEQSYDRKIKEAILAVRMERAFTKEHILELYLNQIFFGFGSYGVAAAAMNYFGKELRDLELEEIAYLAALPKGPNNYHPIRHRERAIGRRNDVIERMIQDGHISRAQGEEAKKKPLVVKQRAFNAPLAAADYFAEQTRRTLIDLYGEQKLYRGGLSVRTTLDPWLQEKARNALRDGLLRYDAKRGWRGPVTTISTAGDWGAALAEIPVLSDLAPWRLGVVLEATKERAVVGLQPPKGEQGAVSPERKTVTVPFSEMRWARNAQRKEDRPKPAKGELGASDILSAGQVIYVAPPPEAVFDGSDDPKKAAAAPVVDEYAKPWRLVQIPEIEGAIVAMDPHTGRVLALVGGFSYAESQFDRAVQARRQPGSTFKPFVYAAALDNGYTPSSIVMDAPLVVDQGGGQGEWKPGNYDGKIGGPTTLRLGVEKSRNLMTVRLAQDLGMPIIGEYSRRFGIYDELLPVLSMALGAGETTLLRMTAAYSSFVNGGKEVNATLIDRIQDRYGKTLWRHDKRECAACAADRWDGQDEPELGDVRKQIVNPLTAYQVTSILEGAVRRGTGYEVSKVGKPLAGKTGTTNDEKDAWFVGFSPDLAVGVFVGFDTPEPMGKGETGGGVAAPIFRDFMKVALADKPAIPFRVPPGVKLVRVNPQTGMRAEPGEPKTILEAFKPNEEPPDPFSYVGYPGGEYGSGGYGGPAAAPAPGDPYGGYGRAPGGYGRQPQAGAGSIY
ncbi:MAG: penicillin-binding protein 1A [Hyphomicrobiales bacterium]|nr:penicillin-binding protein 1A [Hyphomicrobiales bacterium]